MNSYNEKCSNSELYARIKAMPIAARERAVALQTLRNAEGIADGILWVVNGIKHLFAGPALKPGLKH